MNGCDYCLTVHSFMAERMAKMSADEIALARQGKAIDPKRRAAVQFARKVIETRGKVSDGDLQGVRDAGYTEAQVIEIVALVAMFSLTNFFNNVFDHDKDSRFPLDKDHRNLACVACHKPVEFAGRSVVRYKPLGIVCADCHDPRPQRNLPEGSSP